MRKQTLEQLEFPEIVRWENQENMRQSLKVIREIEGDATKCILGCGAFLGSIAGGVLLIDKLASKYPVIQRAVDYLTS